MTAPGPIRPRLKRRRSLGVRFVLRSCPAGNNWRRLQPRDRNERIPDHRVLKQSRDSGRCSRQHNADVAEPRRRCCVESPDLAVAGFDLTNKVSNLRHRTSHALHLFGEPVTFCQYALMLGLQTTIRFKRLQGLDPLGELLPGFVQTIPREMIRIAISQAAFDAIARTMPFGSVNFEAGVDANGERYIWLPRAVVDRLRALRGPGESFSDVILRIAAGGEPH
jgi:hypothetical protein